MKGFYYTFKREERTGVVGKNVVILFLRLLSEWVSHRKMAVF